MQLLLRMSSSHSQVGSLHIIINLSFTTQSRIQQPKQSIINITAVCPSAILRSPSRHLFQPPLIHAEHRPSNIPSIHYHLLSEVSQSLISYLLRNSLYMCFRLRRSRILAHPFSCLSNFQCMNSHQARCKTPDHSSCRLSTLPCSNLHQLKRRHLDRLFSHKQNFLNTNFRQRISIFHDCAISPCTIHPHTHLHSASSAFRIHGSSSILSSPRTQIHRYSSMCVSDLGSSQSELISPVHFPYSLMQSC